MFRVKRAARPSFRGTGQRPVATQVGRLGAPSRVVAPAQDSSPVQSAATARRPADPGVRQQEYGHGATFHVKHAAISRRCIARGLSETDWASSRCSRPTQPADRPVQPVWKAGFDAPARRVVERPSASAVWPGSMRCLNIVAFSGRSVSRETTPCPCNSSAVSRHTECARDTRRCAFWCAARSSQHGELVRIGGRRDRRTTAQRTAEPFGP
jgi:hypothetical protein